MRIGIKLKILVIMLTVGFIPGGVGILSTYIKGSDVFKKSTGQNHVYLSHQIAANIHTVIEKEASESLLISAHPYVQALVQRPQNKQGKLKETVTDYLKLEVENQGHVSIYIYDAAGNLVHQAGTEIGPHINGLKVLTSQKNPLANPLVGAPFQSQAGNNFFIPIYTPIHNSNKDKQVGVIVTFVNIQILLKGIQAESTIETGHFNLVTSSGTVIFDPLIPSGLPPIDKQLMAKVTTGKKPWFLGMDEHGIESVFAFVPLAFKTNAAFSYVGEEMLYVIFTKPTSEAFVKPIRSVLLDAAIPGFLLACLLIFVIYLTLRKIAGPISSLKQGAATIGSGNLDHRIEIHTGDEIEDLANEFNNMTAELKLSYASLEDKVSRRTQELEASYGELEQASGLKTQFLASMSHELRTPLNAIMGFSDVLTEEVYGEINDKQRRYLGNIHKSGKHLLEVINDILDLSKIEAGKMSLNLREVMVEDAMTEIHGLVKQLAHDAEVKLSFNTDGAPELIIADCVRFRQIMYNLLSNAIKFTLEGGSVTVTAEKESEDLTVSVADTGIGIAEDDCHMIFSAFRQVDASSSRSYEGTGLGLALTKKFTVMHGGVISVKSKLGEGSTFTFSIPISGPDPTHTHSVEVH